MSMLAEPRRKVKWTINPNGRFWTEDRNKFGQRMLERMGWSEGKGLGAREQGITSPIEVRAKNDNKGIGASSKDDAWCSQQTKFEDVLANLNGQAGPGAVVAPVRSLEDMSRKTKSRIHYSKFARGKDLSKYSSKDLACILGGPSRDEGPVVNDMEDDVGTVDTTHGVTTVVGGNVQEYFGNTMTSENLASTSTCNSAPEPGSWRRVLQRLQVDYTGNDMTSGNIASTNSSPDPRRWKQGIERPQVDSIGDDLTSGNITSNSSAYDPKRWRRGLERRRVEDNYGRDMMSGNIPSTSGYNVAKELRKVRRQLEETQGEDGNEEIELIAIKKRKRNDDLNKLYVNGSGSLPNTKRGKKNKKNSSEITVKEEKKTTKKELLMEEINLGDSTDGNLTCDLVIDCEDPQSVNKSNKNNLPPEDSIIENSVEFLMEGKVKSKANKKGKKSKDFGLCNDITESDTVVRKENNSREGNINEPVTKEIFMGGENIINDNQMYDSDSDSEDGESSKESEESSSEASEDSSTEESEESSEDETKTDEDREENKDIVPMYTTTEPEIEIIEEKKGKIIKSEILTSKCTVFNQECGFCKRAERRQRKSRASNERAALNDEVSCIREIYRRECTAALKKNVQAANAVIPDSQIETGAGSVIVPVKGDVEGKILKSIGSDEIKYGNFYYSRKKDMAGKPTGHLFLGTNLRHMKGYKGN